MWPWGHYVNQWSMRTAPITVGLGQWLSSGLHAIVFRITSWPLDIYCTSEISDPVSSFTTFFLSETLSGFTTEAWSLLCQVPPGTSGFTSHPSGCGGQWWTPTHFFRAKLSKLLRKCFCYWWDSNSQPSHLESSALPTGHVTAENITVWIAAVLAAWRLKIQIFHGTCDACPYFCRQRRLDTRHNVLRRKCVCMERYTETCREQ